MKEPECLRIIKLPEGWTMDFFGKNYDSIQNGFKVVFCDYPNYYDVYTVIYFDRGYNILKPYGIFSGGRDSVAKLIHYFVLFLRNNFTDIDMAINWLNNYHKRKILTEKTCVIQREELPEVHVLRWGDINHGA